MSIRKSQYRFFREYCIGRFGGQEGLKIYEAAEELTAKMIAGADYRNSKAIRWHMNQNMLPTIAIYLSLKENEKSRDKALDYTAEIISTACRKARRKNRLIGMLPFGYTIFKLLFRKIMTRDYPAEGWNTEWIRYDNEELHFDFTSCIYLDTTIQYGCRELCALFCDSDDITLTGFMPAAVFERTQTLGHGQQRCDFHFYNGKKRAAKGQETRA